MQRDARRLWRDSPLYPADACELDELDKPSAAKSLFSLREGFADPLIEQGAGFARAHQLEITGFEFIETADGRKAVYDVNTNTNCNPDVEAVAPRSGPGSVARYLKQGLAESRQPALV